MGILIKPIVTEKMTAEGEKLNRYGFIVDRKANKLQIKAAVEQMYGVTVADVNTLNYHGKRKQRYTKAGLLRGRCQYGELSRQAQAALHQVRSSEGSYEPLQEGLCHARRRGQD